jgi:hypothetical protein
LRRIESDRERFKASIILLHFWGCISFVLSIAAAAFTILFVSSTMLGFDFGGYQQENYEGSRICLSVGIFLFVVGLGWIWPTYIGRAVSAITGRPDIATTDSSALKDVPLETIAKRKTLERWFFAFFVVLVLFLFSGVFPVWATTLITVATFVLAYFGVKLLETIRHRLRRR